MPLIGPVLGSLILSQMASHGLAGSATPQLAMALGNGIVTNILATGTYVGTSTGLGLGSGVSTGTIVGPAIIGPTVTGLILTNLTAAGLVGQSTPQLADSIGQAFAIHMSTAIVVGASTVVGIGIGVGTIVGIIAPAMGAVIYSQMLAAGLAGTASIQLANAVAMGISTAISTSIVNTTITGVAVGVVPPAFPPIPATGVDSGKIV